MGITGNQVVTDIERAGISSNGWTYFLISPCRRYAKIGKTSGLIESRIEYARVSYIYKDLKLQFAFSVDDQEFETVLHEYYQAYHANYALSIKYNENRAVNSARHYYTLSQANAKLKFYNKSTRPDVFTKTRLELFRFPSPLSVKRTIQKVVEKFDLKLIETH